MSNFNKIFLMGNLTRDPQLSYLPSQTAVVEFGLAINRKWTSREGEKKEETCFVEGRPLFVEGRLTFDSWTAQDGTKRSKHRVTVENFQFIGGASGQGARQTDQYNDETPGQAEQNVNSDDIPF
jgi:single-strand DNA-binding protein